MKYSYLNLAVGIAVMFCAATAASGKQITVGASEVHRVIDPSNGEHARVLLRFEIPVEIQSSYVVRAFLTVATTGEEEVPFAVVEMDQPWSDQDSWESLDSRFGNRLGEPDQAVFVGANESGALRIPLSASTRRWVSSRTNYGICISGYPGREDSTARVLGAGMSPPELTIVYVRREHSPR